MMETAFYDRRSRNLTYEKHCGILIQAFNDVEEIGEDVTEARKMRTCLKGLNDPRCAAAKHTIRVTPNLRNTVANAMDLVAEVLGDIASFTNPAHCNVSEQESSQAPIEGGRGRWERMQWQRQKRRQRRTWRRTCLQCLVL